MRRYKIAALLVGLGLLPAALAQKTTVTGTSLKMSGSLITGSVTIIPVTQQGQPISLTTADSDLAFADPTVQPGNVLQGYSGAITNGVLTSFQVPDQCSANAVIPNTPVYYRVQAYNAATKVQSSFTIPPATVCGGTFALDHYTPAQTAVVTPSGVTSAASLPNGGKCVGAGYVYTYSGSAVTGSYVCVNGSLVTLPTGTGTSLTTVNVTQTAGAATGSVSGSTLSLNIPPSSSLTAGTDYLAPAAVSGLISTATTTEVTNRNAAIGVETARAQAVEGTNTTAISANATALSAEAVTARNASSLNTGSVPAAQLGNVPPPTTAQVVAGLGFTPAAGSQHVAGAVIRLDMLPSHISGGVITDQSGGGNNATLGGLSGSTSPTSTPQGLAFVNSDNVTLPAAINSARSFVFAVYIPPYNNAYSGTASTYPLLFGSSQTSGVDLLVGKVVGGPYSNRLDALNLWVNGASTGTSVPLPAGPHTVTLTLGAGGGDLDHIYVDGAEYASYTSQGSNAAKTTTGNFSLGRFSGASPFNTSGFNGTVYEFAAYTAELTAAQVASESGALAADVIQRGVTWNPLTWTKTTPNLIAVGDSIVCGLGVGAGCSTSFTTNTSAWPSLITVPSTLVTPTVVNLGIPGWEAQTLSTGNAVQLANFCKQTGSGPNIAVLMEGTNDLNSNGYGGASSYVAVGSYIATQIATIKAAGCPDVFVATEIDRNGQSVANENLNAVIRQGWKGWGATGLIDFAADPLLGASGVAPTNNVATTYFQQDGIHPTAAGHSLMASDASRAIGYVFGANESGPTITAAAAYSMAASDGYLDLAPAANGQAITLPSCVGQSGATYRVNNSQSTFTGITLKTFSSAQTVNGIDYSSTGFAVPSNATINLRDVPNAATVSGCHWEM